ncbi:MAG: hypothetical protein ACI3X4_01340 [Bacteroidaceae bacterium]
MMRQLEKNKNPVRKNIFSSWKLEMGYLSVLLTPPPKQEGNGNWMEGGLKQKKSQDLATSEKNMYICKQQHKKTKAHNHAHHTDILERDRQPSQQIIRMEPCRTQLDVMSIELLFVT